MVDVVVESGSSRMDDGREYRDSMRVIGCPWWWSIYDVILTLQ
jgi:hypothetical protein